MRSERGSQSGRSTHRRDPRAKRHPDGVTAEPLEPRSMFSVDADVTAYQARAAQVIDVSVGKVRTWAAANPAIPENAPPTGIGIWTVAAAYARAGNDPALLADAHKAAASLMARQSVDLFSGGNDGWPAWATADTYLRFRPLIDAAPGRYTPAGLAANPASADGKYTLGELFKHVLTQSYYAPIDSTSNHVLMNATARYLAEQAFPGQVAKPYNNSASDPTGANVIFGRARTLVTDGPAEYLSINYGVVNWAEFLSVAQLTTQPANATLARASHQAFEAALAMNAAFWMNGQIAGPTGRGYPNTGAWGAAAGDSMLWTYLGGDFGQAAKQLANATLTDDKTLGVFASVAQFGGTGFTGYTPPANILHLDDASAANPTVTRANFGTNNQYAYNNGTWSTYSESYKWDAFGPYQTTWRTRTIWTKPESQTYQPTAWATNPSSTLNTDGTWNYIDPYTLAAREISGSGSYQGSSVFSDHVQNLNTVLQVFNVPPLSIAGTPGGLTPVRGGVIYVPVPTVTATGRDAADGEDWFRPVLSADGHRLFVAYDGIFMSFASSAPISVGTRVGQKQFYNIYGGEAAGQQADPNVFLQFAIAQETFSPSDYAGTTAAERFANFQTVMNGRALPKKIEADTYHPTWRYADDRATLTSQFGGIYRYARDPKDYTKAFGYDAIGGVGNAQPRVVDYTSWPMLDQVDAAGRVWSNQPQDNGLTLTPPLQTPAYYDFSSWKTYGGADFGLAATSPAGGQIRLDWRPVAGATSYNIERSADGENWTTRASGLTADAMTFTDNGLAQRSLNYYRVTPVGAAVGKSLPIATTATLNAPTNARITLNAANRVTLNWTNNATGASGVRLEFSLDGSTQWRLLGNFSATTTSRSQTYTDFAGGERLFYRVRSYGTGPNNTTVLSPPSNIVGTEFSPAYIGGTTSMPRFLDAAGSPTQIRLQWLDTATNETAYQIERSTGGGAWTVLTSSLPPNASEYVDPNVTAGAAYTYRVAARNAAAMSAYSNLSGATVSAANVAPSVATAASVANIGDTTATLAVLGADDADIAGLRYHWQAAAGPGAVSFSINYTNDARSTIATFSRAGTYTLSVKIVDAQGLVTTSNVVVTVRQAATRLSVSPPEAVATVGRTSRFAASLLDQFGHEMPGAATWLASRGTIDASGLFTAPVTPGVAVIAASVGDLLTSVTVSIAAGPAPVAYYRFEDGAGSASAADASGNGHTANLGATGAIIGAGRNGGGLVLDGLTGIATIGSPPGLSIDGRITLAAWVKPSSASGLQTIVGRSYSNSPRAETVLRINAGRYEVGAWNGTTFMAGGGNVAADLNTWVFLVGTFDGTAWTLYRNGTQIARTAATVGSIVSSVPWSIGASASGTGSRFFKGIIDGVRIYDTPLNASEVATLHLSDSPPTVASSATAGPITGGRATLDVMGASDAGEAALAYTWSVLGVAPGTVTFDANGTNAAKRSVASFAAAGTYHLVVTITDANGRATASVVRVVVASPSWLDNSGRGATWNPLTRVLTVTGPARIIADPAADAPTVVATGSAAALTIESGAGRVVQIAGISLSNGATATLAMIAGGNETGERRVLMVGSQGLTETPAFAIDTTSRLDLMDNAMALRYVGSESPAETIRAAIAEAYAGGQWTGAGLTSTAAAAGGGRSALGWTDASTFGYTEIDGVPLGGNAVLVKFVQVGDVNLDGRVDFRDFLRVRVNYDRPGTWSSGDFNYNGVVDFNDFLRLRTNYVA